MPLHQCLASFSKLCSAWRLSSSAFNAVCAPPPLPVCAQDVQYNQVLQAVLLAQFEMQRRPGEFREEINLPDRIVDRALAAWKQQQQVRRRQTGRSRWPGRSSIHMPHCLPASCSRLYCFAACL